MLSIDKQHIQQLRFDDFQDLIGLLCEAELRRYGQSGASVRWGGARTATDGGIDVLVNATSLPYENGYVIRPNTGFQAKVSALTPAGVQKAMTHGKKGN